MTALVAALSAVLAIFGFGTCRNVLGALALSIFLWCIIIELMRPIF